MKYDRKAIINPFSISFFTTSFAYFITSRIIIFCFCSKIQHAIDKRKKQRIWFMFVINVHEELEYFNQ
jgi:hypothetical protein